MCALQLFCIASLVKQSIAIFTCRGKSGHFNESQFYLLNSLKRCSNYENRGKWRVYVKPTRITFAYQSLRWCDWSQMGNSNGIPSTLSVHHHRQARVCMYVNVNRIGSLTHTQKNRTNKHTHLHHQHRRRTVITWSMCRQPKIWQFDERLSINLGLDSCIVSPLGMWIVEWQMESFPFRRQTYRFPPFGAHAMNLLPFRWRRSGCHRAKYRNWRQKSFDIRKWAVVCGCRTTQ